VIHAIYRTAKYADNATLISWGKSTPQKWYQVPQSRTHTLTRPMKCSLIGNWSGGSSLSNCEAFGPYNEKAGRCTSNADSDIKAKT